MNLLTRKQVAMRLGCSEWQVCRFEGEGRLKPKREKPEGQHGRVWHYPEQVEKLAREWVPKRTRPERIDSKLVECNVRGKIAARVFPLLDQGKSLKEIVIETEADPLLVRQLEQEWQQGFDDGKRAAAEKAAREAEREAQRWHDKQKSYEEWREFRIRLERIKARQA